MKHPLFRLLIALTVTAVLSIGCSGINTKQQKIALACEGAATAADAIAKGAQEGKVSKADAQRALTVYRGTVSFCEPKPAASLSPADYAALLSAAATLATQKDAIR